MPELTLHGRQVGSVFELLGAKENDITYSIAWTLSRSESLLGRLLRHVAPSIAKRDLCNLALSIQEHSKGGGFTDIELKTQEEHVIIEAKRGWALPSEAQLRKYAVRFRRSRLAHPLLVTMSEASVEFARLHLPDSIDGIPIIHVPYAKVAEMCSIKSTSHAEKRLLAELHSYLSRIVPMQNKESNWVYVVSLGNHEWAPGLTFIQVVEDRNLYFHPFGRGGWPKEPPNYLGFRYHDRLRSIRHVRSAEVITNFHKIIPEQKNKEVLPHVCYRLGPPIEPASTVKSGPIHNARMWAMIDLLLTCKTISEASKKSYKRVG